LQGTGLCAKAACQGITSTDYTQLEGESCNCFWN
jgi:hypothetical protein